MGIGEQCVMMPGTSGMPMWFADSWDSMVRYRGRDCMFDWGYTLLICCLGCTPIGINTTYVTKLPERTLKKFTRKACILNGTFVPSFLEGGPTL